MYDVKTYKDGVEKETIKGLSLSQVVALESCLQRHGVKHSVKENAAQHGAERTETKVVLDGTFQCPECHFTEKHLASCSRR